MLIIDLAEREFWDEAKNAFITVPSIRLELEHSLVSLSKWESIHNKPFLGKDEKTPESVMDYIRSMILTPNVPDNVTLLFSSDDFEKVNDYINSTQSATTFYEYMPQQKPNQEIVTAELIYFWMVSFQIPLECENWHLNRLFSLLRISSIKNSKQKKIPRSEIARRNHELNEQRKAQLGTTG